MVVAIGSEIVGPGILFHAHFALVGGSIDLLDPNTGAIVTSYPQDDVVGMARVGTDIWISKWGSREVGTDRDEYFRWSLIRQRMRWFGL
jgi:hypothetical protein